MNAQVQENLISSENFDILETLAMTDDQQEKLFQELELQDSSINSVENDDDIQFFSDELMDEMITFYN